LFNFHQIESFLDEETKKLLFATLAELTSLGVPIVKINNQDILAKEN